VLLVFDNCEHVIDAAAALASAVLQGAPGLHILATSREPLRVEGERMHRLAPLPCPATAVGLTATEALRFPAVQLFVERATGALGEFELSHADAPIVAEVCQQLDGLPLAIELAAARVDAFGVRGLAARLNDRLRLLTLGRRTAVARHRTIGATLDWSYSLLSGAEQAIFRRLAIFAGGFTLDAAGAVAADADQPAAELVDLGAISWHPQPRSITSEIAVAGQQQLSTVGRRDMQINHLHGGELFDGAARREARRQGHGGAGRV
jgi:predicted ATPase